MAVVKIIETIGISEKSFDDALNQALERTCSKVRNVTGAKIVSQNVDIENGKIVRYKVNAKIAFTVE